MSLIKSIKGRQVFDSRGNPTVEAEVILNDETIGVSIVPSGELLQVDMKPMN